MKRQKQFGLIVALGVLCCFFIPSDLSAQDVKTKAVIKGAQIAAKPMIRAIATNPGLAAQVSKVVGKSVVKTLKDPKVVAWAMAIGGTTGTAVGVATHREKIKAKQLIIQKKAHCSGSREVCNQFCHP